MSRSRARDLFLRLCMTVIVLLGLVQPSVAPGARAQVGIADQFYQTDLPSRTPTYASLPSSTGDATLIVPGNASALAAAMDVNPADLVSASIGTSDSLGTGIGNTALSHFPRQGGSFAILSTGLASSADDVNNSEGLSYDLGGLSNSQGNDLVQLTLDLRVPSNRNCLSVDFAFYSEEFTEFVGSIFNDTFTGEHGGTNLSINGNQVTAPWNFAFDTSKNIISVNTVFGVSQNTGTTYDGGTPLLTARRHVSPGSTIKLVFSVQDLGDSIYDSAVFLDNLRWTLESECPPGANLPTTVYVEHMEVTQSVQCLQASACWNNQLVPLVRDKPTYVRLYVKSLSGSVSGVRATLTGVRDNVSLGSINSVNAVRAKTSGGDRSKLGDTLYFKLPDNWVSGSTLILNAALSCSNCTPGAIGPRAANFTARAIPVIRIKPVRVKFGLLWLTPNVNRARSAAQVTERSYPASRFDLDVLGSMDFTECKLEDSDCSSRLDLALSTARVTDNVPTQATLYGALSALASTNDLLGEAFARSRNAWGKVGGLQTPLWDFKTFAHEVGHVYGAGHVTACSKTPDYAYTDYPWPDGHIGGSAQGAYGFNTSNKTLYEHSIHDYMTYCSVDSSRTWVSDFVYSVLFNGIGAPNQGLLLSPSHPTWSPGQQFILASGVLTPATETVDLDPMMILPDRGDYVAPGNGAYAIEIQDAQGSVLASQAFSPTAVFEGSNVSLPFFQVLPWPATGKTIRVVKNSVVLAQRTASANPPSVTILSPNGGAISGTVTLTWQAQDPDLDPLFFHVQYSSDDGLTWSTLASNVITPSIEVDTSELAGSSVSRFRVMVTDGVNTAQDDTDGPVTVNRKPPVVEIVEPATGSSFTVGHLVVLRGSAYDLEDGLIPDGALAWTSSISGVVGVGSSLAVDTLPIGTHVLTLTAADSDNNTVQTSTTIVITNAVASLAYEAQALNVTLTGLEVVTKTITISSTGTADLEWTILADAPWLKISPTGSVLAPGESQTVAFVFDRSGYCQGGSFAADVMISSNDAVQASITRTAALSALPLDCVYLPTVSRNYAAPAVGFNSQFNGSAAGWVPHTGAWSVDGYYYSTPGLLNAWASASYTANYTGLDYQARLWRYGCDTCSNQVVVRGAPTPLRSDGSWYSYYSFNYTRSGYYSIWKSTAGSTPVALKAWTYTSAIYRGNAWNTLRVVAYGPSLYFYINGTLVWVGGDSSLTAGRVGLGMYRSSSNVGDYLYVDWATLNPLSAGTSDEILPNLDAVSWEPSVARTDSSLSENPNVAPLDP